MKRGTLFVALLAATSIFLILMSGCFKGNESHLSPTNQQISGPFAIGPDWKIIELEKPLATIPHVQDITMLLDNDAYEEVQGLEPSEFNIFDSGYRQLSTGEIIKPEVVLLDSRDREFRVTNTVIGYDNTLTGTPLQYLGFGINSKNGKLYFPEGIEFVSIKVRSNVNMRVEHFYWDAPYFHRNPDKKWSDADPSKILDWD